VSRLGRILRLFAVTVLIVAGTCAVTPQAVAAGEPRDDKPLPGIELPALVELCDHYRGKFVEELEKPYRYGCVLPDGDIRCDETTACTFFRLADGLPFEQTCDRIGGKWYYLRDLYVVACWTVPPFQVVLECDPEWETCSIGHDQPMP
jgi:hypothetical protein